MSRVNTVDIVKTRDQSSSEIHRLPRLGSRAASSGIHESVERAGDCAGAVSRCEEGDRGDGDVGGGGARSASETWRVKEDCERDSGATS
jgi:hypothetical protein